LIERESILFEFFNLQNLNFTIRFATFGLVDGTPLVLNAPPASILPSLPNKNVIPLGSAPWESAQSGDW
jgi:hypothetical protein